MNNYLIKKIKKNIFLNIFILIFLISIIHSLYQIKKFDRHVVFSDNIELHSMIRGDIEDFWFEGDKIVNDLKKDKSYLESGDEYRRPYLPSKLFALYSVITNKKLYENGKVSLDNSKFLILFFQTLIYFGLLFLLYKKVLDIFEKNVAQLTILFLAIEPTLFFYHSSFWSESIFFSLQLLIIIFILKKNFNNFDYLVLGLFLGLFYLQRSVAIFYIFPILLLFYIKNKNLFLKSSIIILTGYLLIHVFVGYHNYVRSGVFYSTSTQAKDGFYIYLAPNILSEKLNISNKDAKKILDKKKQNWMEENNIDYKNGELDKLSLYKFQQKEAFKIIIQNPINSLIAISKKTLHFLVLDPLTHVYYFHRQDDDILFYESENHKKWILPRIIYSIFIYFVCLLGLIFFYKNRKNRTLLYYLLLSILYFTAVQSWYGGTRYFAPIIIYLSFFFSHGLIFIKKKYFN